MYYIFDILHRNTSLLTYRKLSPYLLEPPTSSFCRNFATITTIMPLIITPFYPYSHPSSLIHPLQTLLPSPCHHAPIHSHSPPFTPIHPYSPLIHPHSPLSLPSTCRGTPSSRLPSCLATTTCSHCRLATTKSTARPLTVPLPPRPPPRPFHPQTPTTRPPATAQLFPCALRVSITLRLRKPYGLQADYRLV